MSEFACKVCGGAHANGWCLEGGKKEQPQPSTEDPTNTDKGVSPREEATPVSSGDIRSEEVVWAEVSSQSLLEQFSADASIDHPRKNEKTIGSSERPLRTEHLRVRGEWLKGAIAEIGRRIDDMKQKRRGAEAFAILPASERHETPVTDRPLRPEIIQETIDMLTKALRNAERDLRDL